MKLKTLVFVLVTFVLVVGLTAIALAQGGDPLTLFTDNVPSTGPTPGVTVMEQQLLDRLNAATTSIDVAIYGLDRVSVRDALIDAHNRGVTVRVVGDDDAYDQPSYNPHFQALEAAGIPLVRDNRSSLMHNKFFVIDGLVVWSGSTNLTVTGFTYNHNNSLVFTSTQLANIFTAEFEEMYVSGLFGTAKTDNTTHSLTYAGFPLELYFSPTDGAMSELISEVNAADESIYFSISSFTDDSLRDAIIARAQAGVTVQGIFDRFLAANQHSVDEALCDANIPVKIEDFGGKMHNKFMVVDSGGADPVVVTGSMDWTSSGGSANDENTLIVHDLGTAQAYVAAFQELYDALGDDTLCTDSYQIFLPLVQHNEVSGPEVHITYIEYDPPGDDLAGEYAKIENMGGAPVSMTGWTLRGEHSDSFTFPSFRLDAGASVRVWTKAGTDTATDLYWGRGWPAWANPDVWWGDCGTLRNSYGSWVSRYCY